MVRASSKKITKGASNLFRGFLPFLNKFTKLKASTATPPFEVHGTFSTLGLKYLQSHLKPSGKYNFSLLRHY